MKYLRSDEIHNLNVYSPKMHKKMRNLCMYVRVCTIFVHTSWEMHKKSQYLCELLMS